MSAFALLPDILLETWNDSWKLLPFLFAAYLLMEFLEHEAGDKTAAVIAGSRKSGPLWGSLLGVVPQCGFAAIASEFYAHGVITFGTLMAIYLSTSDEMLPILVASRAPGSLILGVLGAKVLAGIFWGFMLDLLLRNRHRAHTGHCKVHEAETGSVILNALRHSLEIFAFLLILTLLINCLIAVIGEEEISGLILNKPLAGECIAGLIGLIPNCAGSVIITDLYLNGMISFGALMAGLFAAAGVGPLMLFRTNSDRKENWKVIVCLYGVSVVTGLLLGLIV